MKQLHIHDRVLTLHGACTNGTSRVLTVALLQRLKMEAFILAPANCEVWSVIKILNAESIAPIKFLVSCASSHFPQNCHRAPVVQEIVCQVGATATDTRTQSKAHWQLWFIFSYTSRNYCPINVSVCIRTEGRRWVSHSTVIPIPGGRPLRPRGTKVGPMVWQMSQIQRWICWKIAQ